MKRCKKSLFLLCFAMIGFSLIPLCSSVKAKPNITFEQNITPFLTVTKNPMDNPNAFRFQWFNYGFDVNLHVNTTEIKPETIHNQHSLKSFTNKFNVTVNYLSAKEQNQTRFGWVIENVDKVTEKVNDVTFQINNTYPFSFKEITIEVKEIPDKPFNETILHFPRNLALSFDDLREKGFSIVFQNETSTIIKGFSNKTKWDFDPIIHSSNVMTSIGGTEGTQLNFNDLYEADKNGTLILSSASQRHYSETRLFDSTSWGGAEMPNGLDSRKLHVIDNPIGGGAYPFLDGNATLLNGTWGVRVWARHENESETEVTSGVPVAQVIRSTESEGYQNGTWSCPQTELETTDSIRVNFYLCVDGLFNWTALQWNGKDWSTEELNSDELIGATWTIEYYTKLTNNSGTFRYLFYTGNAPAYLSYLYNFQWHKNVPLSQQVQPADDLALKLNLIVTNLFGSGNTTLFGYDKDGVAQNETVSIIANTTYVTELWFKNVTQVSCSGNFTLEITQSRWGVIWETGITQYAFDCKLVFGNGTVAGTTWFGDTNKHVIFNDGIVSGNSQDLMRIYRYATVTFGELVDVTEKIGRNGVHFMSLEDTRTSTRVFRVESYAELYFYESSLFSPNKDHTSIVYANCIVRLWSCLIFRVQIYGYEFDLFDVTLMGTKAGGQIALRPLGTWNVDNIFVTNVQQGLYLKGTGSTTLENAYFRNNTYQVTLTSVTVDSHLVNPDFDAWVFSFSGSSTAEIYRQYTFDLIVTYPNGTSINGTATGARVTLQHYGNNSGVDYNATLNGDGTINQTTLNMGFYNQTGGNTIYNYDPYSLTISNVTGFQTYMKNFTLSGKTDWTISLTQSVGSSAILLLACLIILPIIVVIGVFIVKWT